MYGDLADNSVSARLIRFRSETVKTQVQQSPPNSVVEPRHWGAVMSEDTNVENPAKALARPHPAEFEPVYAPWRHGGWYVTNVRYPSGAVGCVSRNYPEKKWRSSVIQGRLTNSPPSILGRRRRSPNTNSSVRRRLPAWHPARRWTTCRPRPIRANIPQHEDRTEPHDGRPGFPGGATQC